MSKNTKSSYKKCKSCGFDCEVNRTLLPVDERTRYEKEHGKARHNRETCPKK